MKVTVYSLDKFLSQFWTSPCFRPGSSCCFLTHVQVSQEMGKVVWYSHLLKNFPQFVVIHTIKGFGIVNKAEIDLFWNSRLGQVSVGPFVKPVQKSGGCLWTPGEELSMLVFGKHESQGLASWRWKGVGKGDGGGWWKRHLWDLILWSGLQSEVWWTGECKG